MIYVSEWRSGEEMRRKLKSEALKTEFAVQIKELRLNKMLVGSRGARRHLNDISLVLFSTFLRIFEPTSAAAATRRSSRNASSSRHFESKYYQDKATDCNEPAKNEIDKWVGST